MSEVERSWKHVIGRWATPSEIAPGGPSTVAWWDASIRMHFRMTRWHLKRAREDMFALRGMCYQNLDGSYTLRQSASKRLVAAYFDSLMHHIGAANDWRSNARGDRRRKHLLMSEGRLTS